jgi:hypothetical protein
MLLLVTPSHRGSEFATALNLALGEKVTVAVNSRRANALLRNAEFDAIILDEPVVENEPDGIDVLLENAGIALPVYINLAISGGDRVVREVRMALRRYREERLVAMRSAATLLRTELRGAVAGILLSTELAMKNPSMPIDARSKLQSVCELAGEIRTRLETP